MKICKNPTCRLSGNYQSFRNFYRDTARADNLSRNCKICEKELAKKRRDAK